MNRDWDLKLLAKKPIYVDNIPIYSPLLSDIAEIGEDKYNSFLLYTTNLLDAIDSKIDIDTEYNAMLMFIASSDKYLAEYLQALKFFTGLEFNIRTNSEELFFISSLLSDSGEDIILHKDNYDDFSYAIKYSNGIDNSDFNDESDDLPDDVIESIKAMEDIKESMNNDKDNVESVRLKDYISSLANMTGNGLNILNIWDINKYTLYEQLKRGQLKETFEYEKEKILTGLIDPKDIKLEHYITKIS